MRILAFIDRVREHMDDARCVAIAILDPADRDVAHVIAPPAAGGVRRAR